MLVNNEQILTETCYDKTEIELRQSTQCNTILHTMTSLNAMKDENGLYRQWLACEVSHSAGPQWNSLSSVLEYNSFHEHNKLYLTQLNSMLQDLAALWAIHSVLSSVVHTSMITWDITLCSKMVHWAVDVTDLSLL